MPLGLLVFLIVMVAITGWRLRAYLMVGVIPFRGGNLSRKGTPVSYWVVVGAYAIFGLLMALGSVGAAISVIRHSPS